MSKFNYQTELKTIISTQKLVEVHLHDAPTFKVAYLLDVNEKFLTFAEVSSAGLFAGVIICLLEDVDFIKVDTLYLVELIKQVNANEILNQSSKYVNSIKKFNFETFSTTMKNSHEIVEISQYGEAEIAGKIIDIDDTVIAVDEYYAEYASRLARTYVNRGVVARLAVGLPWLKTIARSLADKNL